MAKDLMQVIKGIINTEKSASALENRTYVMKVGREYSKLEVKKAIEKTYSVEVQAVHCLNVLGKVKRHGQRLGRRGNWKKAYIKLKPGQTIDLGQVQ